MGNCLSDPSSDAPKKSKSSSSKPPSGGQRLGSTPTSAPPPAPAAVPPSSSTAYQQPQTSSVNRRTNGLVGGRNTLGDGFEDPLRAKGGEAEAREARLKAAEERAAKNSQRGISTSNPKAGQLTAKLQEQNREIDRMKPASPTQHSLSKPQDWN